MRGSWEQLPLLKDQLLESQEKLLKDYKELLALEEEKKEREATLAEAWEASRKAVEEATLLRERTVSIEEAASKAHEEAKFYKDVARDEGGVCEGRDHSEHRRGGQEEGPRGSRGGAGSISQPL